MKKVIFYFFTSFASFTLGASASVSVEKLFQEKDKFMTFAENGFYLQEIISFEKSAEMRLGLKHIATVGGGEISNCATSSYELINNKTELVYMNCEEGDAKTANKQIKIDINDWVKKIHSEKSVFDQNGNSIGKRFVASLGRNNRGEKWKVVMWTNKSQKNFCS